MKIGDPKIAIFTFLGGSGGPPGVPLGAKIEHFQLFTFAATPGVPKMAPDPPKKVKIAILTLWVIMNSPKDHIQEMWSKSVKWY